MSVEKVGIRELKQNSSVVVARARTGASIVVTDRGIPVARLIPYTDSPVEDAIAAGLASVPTQSIHDMLRGIPDGEITTVLSDTLARIREDNRL